MIKLIHHSIESGITFLDTSDVYSPYANEILIGKALKKILGLGDKVKLMTKFEILYVSDKFREIPEDPAYVRVACEARLKRLDVDFIDLYYAHRILIPGKQFIN